MTNKLHSANTFQLFTVVVVLLHVVELHQSPSTEQVL